MEPNFHVPIQGKQQDYNMRLFYSNKILEEWQCKLSQACTAEILFLLLNNNNNNNNNNNHKNITRFLELTANHQIQGLFNK